MISTFIVISICAVAVFVLGHYVSMFFYPRGIRFRFMTDEQAVEKYISDGETRALRVKLESLGYTCLGVLSETTPFWTVKSLTLASDKNKAFAYISKTSNRVHCSFHTPFEGGGMLFTTNAPFPKIKGKHCLLEVFPNAGLKELVYIHAERLEIFIAKGRRPCARYDRTSRVEAARQFYANRSTKWGLVFHTLKTFLKPALSVAVLLTLVGMVYLLTATSRRDLVLRPTTFSTITATMQPSATPAIPITKSLADQFGYTDVTIQAIQNQYSDCRIAQQREWASQYDVYIAHIIKCRQMSHLLVYKHEINSRQRNCDLMLLFSDVEICFQCGGISGDNWQDVDRDGRSDLIVGRGSNHDWTTYVYRMTDRGELENLLIACPLGLPGVIPSFEDVNQDGVWELAVYDTRWDYDTTDIGWYLPSIKRVYSLQNCEYHDRSADFPELYQPSINVFYRNYEYILSGGVSKQLGTLTAIEGLLACDAVGRREECWPAFWEMTDLEKHPLSPSDPQHPDYDPEAIELEGWVTKMRDTLRRQYEDGLPFCPDFP